MDLNAAQTLARALIAKHLDSSWAFSWNNRKTSFGLCRYVTREIQLSRVLTATESGDATEQTILHEIAHAIAGPEHKHDRVWQSIARSIGVRRPASRRAFTGEPPKPKYLLKVGERVIRAYHRHPGQAFVASLPKRYLQSDREGTLGKLRLVLAE
jgi:predicted SprT family Zn-dependent metalloprotease